VIPTEINRKAHVTPLAVEVLLFRSYPAKPTVIAMVLEVLFITKQVAVLAEVLPKY
jgi:hypothetical protein